MKVLVTCSGGVRARVASSIRPSACAASVAARQAGVSFVMASPSERLAGEQARRSAAFARRLLDQQALQRRRAIDEAKAKIAQSAQRRKIIGEEAVHHVHA